MDTLIWCGIIPRALRSYQHTCSVHVFLPSLSLPSYNYQHFWMIYSRHNLRTTCTSITPFKDLPLTTNHHPHWMQTSILSSAEAPNFQGDKLTVVLLGRTGVLICCFFIFSERLKADEVSLEEGGGDRGRLFMGKGTSLTLPLPRVINVKFPWKPHQKCNNTRYGERGFS